MKQYLHLKEVRVQNANALSSPFTFGFPAITAFMGFAHALQRFLNSDNAHEQLSIDGVGIVNHSFEMQDYLEGFSRSLKLTANPLDKDGNRPSFVEEGRCHLSVSLVLEISNAVPGEAAQERLRKRVSELASGRMKLAGGDILFVKSVDYLVDEKRSLAKLMPGYAIIERRELMQQAMRQGQDAIDALHHFLKINFSSTITDDEKVEWTSERSEPGWLVPLATGFQAVGEITETAEVRDIEVPHRFSESIVTLGEFVMPCRLDTLSTLVWRYHHDGSLYTCRQNTAI